eukprot:INCI1372.3.p1 GENE.INCI1372.3~~INCI1372.3.p1  ORF type:complete len:1140 (-),score=150.09 INCI1372.3:204-3623(-)
MAAPSPAASGVSTEASSGLTTPATENIDNLAAFFTSNTQQFYFGFWGSVFDGIQMDISCDEPRNYSFAYLFQDGYEHKFTFSSNWTGNYDPTVQDASYIASMAVALVLFGIIWIMAWSLHCASLMHTSLLGVASRGFPRTNSSPLSVAHPPMDDQRNREAPRDEPSSRPQSKDFQGSVSELEDDDQGDTPVHDAHASSANDSMSPAARVRGGSTMRTILVIDNDEEPMVAEFSIHDATMRTLKLQVQAQRAVELSRIHLFLNQQEVEDNLLIRGSGVNYVHKRQVLRAFDPTQQMYYVHVRIDPIANLCHLVFRNARYHEDPPTAPVWRWLDNCLRNDPTRESSPGQTRATHRGTLQQDAEAFGDGDALDNMNSGRFRQSSRLGSDYPHMPADGESLASPANSWRRRRSRGVPPGTTPGSRSARDALNAGGGPKARGSPGVFDDSGRNKSKFLLQGVSASFTPGSLNAIVSDDEASARVLMRMLAGHVLPGDLSVEMAINGFPVGSNYHRFVVFIGQNDVLLESLTVYQAVLFEAAASIDLEGIDVKQDLALRVRSILKLLEMEAVADQRLRDLTEPGQTRRVQLAVALAANPSLIFFDRFIHGLSGSEALVLTIQLRKLASEGRTIVCNVVDPREEVLELFDTVLVLTGGRPAYFGNLDDFHSFANRHECGIPRGMNLATFLAKQTIDARTANNNVLRHSHHSSWRRRPSNQSTHTRADVVGRMKSSTSSPSEAINGPSSTADEAVGIGRASGTSDPESGLARNSSSTRGPELLRASSLRRTQSTRTGRRVLAKLATAYENSPEAYENNSIVTAVIDGTLQDMPRAPDLFMRTKSSFPNPTWTQISLLVQRHHAATLWEPRFYIHVSIIVGLLFLSGMLYVGQPLYRGIYNYSLYNTEPAVLQTMVENYFTACNLSLMIVFLLLSRLTTLSSSMSEVRKFRQDRLAYRTSIVSFFVADFSTAVCYDSVKALLYSIVIFWWFGITTDPTSSISTGGGAGNFFFFVLMNFLALVFSKAMILGLLLLTNSVATAMKVYILCVIIPYSFGGYNLSPTHQPIVHTFLYQFNYFKCAPDDSDFRKNVCTPTFLECQRVSISPIPAGISTKPTFGTHSRRTSFARWSLRPTRWTKFLMCCLPSCH